MTIENFDKNLWRSPHPDYSQLAKLGFGAVINLQPSYREIWTEMFDAKAQRIVVHPMPLCPVLPPSRAATLYIVDVLKSLSEPNVRSVAGKVLLHCTKGVDRTGYIVAAYRVLIQRQSIDDACTEWKAKGRSPWLFWWARQFRKDMRDA